MCGFLVCLLLFVLLLFFHSIMEHQPQYQQSQQQSTNEDGICGSAKGGYLCRQSSTRWTPTTDQIRILKDLYYNSGVRSPSAEQIQRISARLRQYGKIEGKNVFYWFQNHKARERQKKRFTSDVPIHKGANVSWKPDHESIHKYSHTSVGVSSAPSSSAGMGNVGQIGTYGCGSATMEKSFRDCSISAADSNGNLGGALGHSWGLVGVDPYSHATYTLIDKRRPTYEHTMEEDQEDEAGPEIETLPLFPMHGEDFHGYCQLQPDPVYSAYYGAWYRTEDGNNNISRTSLELSLNSYGPRSPDSA